MSDTSYLNWPFFEQGHQKLSMLISVWAEREITPLAQKAEAKNNNDLDAQCAEILKKLSKANFLNYAIPDPSCENLKHNVRSICLIREMLAKHMGLADFVFAMQGLGSGSIAMFGTPEQKEKYLLDARSGKKVAAFALSEPNAGSDVAAIATTATEDGDDYIISGEKAFISNGGIADFYCVFARTSEGEGAKGLSAFIVDKNTAGLNVEKRVDLIAPLI